nr:Ldh family oxidoreductase [Spirochaetia bacterium]
MGESITVLPEKLKAYIKEMYSRAGLPEEDAGICADCTVKTNLWGVDSHGVLRTAAYINRILSGAVKANPEFRFIKGEDGPISLVDGGAGMGYVVGTKAIKAAITKAEKFGIGMVVVNNSNHFGAASLYARLAAESGMLAIVTTNVIPNIGMPGNKKSVTGNNPIAMAAPIGKEYPFSLD